MVDQIADIINKQRAAKGATASAEPEPAIANKTTGKTDDEVAMEKKEAAVVNDTYDGDWKYWEAPSIGHITYTAIEPDRAWSVEAKHAPTYTTKVKKWTLQRLINDLVSDKDGQNIAWRKKAGIMSQQDQEVPIWGNIALVCITPPPGSYMGNIFTNFTDKQGNDLGRARLRVVERSQHRASFYHDMAMPAFDTPTATELRDPAIDAIRRLSHLTARLGFDIFDENGFVKSEIQSHAVRGGNGAWQQMAESAPIVVLECMKVKGDFKELAEPMLRAVCHADFWKNEAWLFVLLSSEGRGDDIERSVFQGDDMGIETGKSSIYLSACQSIVPSSAISLLPWSSKYSAILK